MPIDNETYFIDKLIMSGITLGIGDDAVVFTKRSNSFYQRTPSACLPQNFSSLVYAMDMFWEGIHFKQDWLSPQQISKKAFLVNISDIIAMNADPKYALLGICLPKNISKIFINKLIEGMVEICKNFRIKIIGGDTIGGDRIGLAITLIGEARKNILFREKAKVGDLIFHTGQLGGSHKELLRLLRYSKFNTTKQVDFTQTKKSRFYEPILRKDFIRDVAKFAHLGTDISDGVAQELNRLCKLNRLCFKLFCPQDFRHKSAEEYEMLFCISSKDAQKVKILAKKHRIILNCIGRVTRGKNAYKVKSWH